jgi:hypothetical protein
LVSGAIFAATEFGVSIGTASDGLNFVVRIKKERSKKATSHIAVISTVVLFRGIFGLAIFINLNLHTKLDANTKTFHTQIS